MIRPRVSNIIHVVAFDKVREALNKVHHEKQTNWDLHVPVVLWAYRTMCKTLTTRTLLKLKYEAVVIVPIKYAKPSPRRVVPIDTIVHKAWKEGIT